MENVVPAIGRREVLGGGALTLAGLTIAGLANGQARPAGEIQLSNAEWRKRLGPQRFHILREAGTERPYSSPLNGEKRRGVFSCGGCGLPLFSSTTKFESGTGWPSFFRALPKAVITRADYHLGMRRTEVLCRRCGGHLGHVFPDGPRPTGQRYCMNGLSLRFTPA
jgi:peptide-methionine (R)-S-oxide reductase